jgi:galactokinase
LNWSISRAQGADRVAFEPADLAAALRAHYPEAGRWAGAIGLVRAPGRVNLIGEHTDYNGGLVLPVAIDLEVRIAFTETDDRVVDLTRLDDGTRSSFDLDRVPAPSGGWIDYVAGTAQALIRANLEIRGIRGVIASTLPPNAGLSSSAAIESAAAVALLGEAAAGVDRMTIAQVCQQAENAYVGVRCGLLDQFAVAFGIAGAALLFDCTTLRWEPVPLPHDLALVICHTGSARRLTSSAYNSRRAECEAAVAEFARTDPSLTSLRDISMEMVDSAADRLDPVVARRARHVIGENSRVAAVADALRARDFDAVGRLFRASHESLRDLFDVSSPELDALVEIARSVDGVIGARMTGAGFGGCTVNLVRPDAIGRLRSAVMTDYLARTGLSPRVWSVSSPSGFGRIS